MKGTVYDDPDFGPVYIPPPRLRDRARAWWHFFRVELARYLSERSAR